MHGNNDPNKKAPDSGRVKIDLSKINPKKIDDFRDMIKREQERMKQNQSSSSKSGQGSSK
ncbi:hypothetical protein HGO53_03345 [Wolbachia endosymbiont of Diaphorina citri]|jgi:hypothetical protein|uniref:hypothetical protein n=1 Tax=Wolbachia endosymbiont of Diaphorina citri TaxID=116598 RepID=UPI00155DFB4D|nr:hypothetical protein [Wolbachia endosymbiont of Diaphorina citri]QJT94340.1 hypothetical protein HGO48_02635 [Wolbachia endosymbiont of Diaphorina citri]QJT95580.1 hypothetical protein HGO49_02635 [Wolbachia endosymbiont of Diaphorina citri]QJT96942.1 hypothetical protein HGO53_03345 [Wolbachia endosymbiont of Diaphorina citri]QLK11239.1 hypothetical protein FK497_02685 [Wolbachia endosymbiont of Diaphorina citri]QXY87229.1 hypothetical protein GZ064_05055 [Wolbachia endosymbiont of Diaphor